MKSRFTYKELSILIGIVVAIIIVLTLWMNPMPAENEDVSRKFIPKLSAPASQTFVKKVTLLIQDYSL